MNMTKKQLGMSLLLAGVLLSGCGGGGGGPAPEETVIVTGLAKQESEALADAGTVVTVGTTTALTVSPPKANPSGDLYNFSIAVPRSASKGTFTQGTVINEFPLTVTVGGTLPATSFDIGTVYVGSSSGVCQVTGRVVNTKSEVVPSAMVTIGKFSVTTGTDGTFSFAQAPAWFSTVTISATNYDTRTIVLATPLVKSISNNLGDLRFQDDIPDNPPPPPF